MDFPSCRQLREARFRVGSSRDDSTPATPPGRVVCVREERYDLAIVGSAFGGSLLAMIARRLGRSVVLIERGRHPRFAIGESSTPLASLLLEELAIRYDLPRLLPLTKWGSWQREHPQLACGLKRGFTFLHHEAGLPWNPRGDRSNELMVEASPANEIADTHWYRPDFDHWFQREAVAMGAAYSDDTDLRGLVHQSDALVLGGTRNGESVRFRARLVVDASGPHGFLSRTLGLGESPWPDYPATQALYTHFRSVERWEAMQPSAEAPPYPPDDAALHHVFEGGWMWVLRFNNGVTSAGVSVSSSLAEELRLSDGAPAWDRLLRRFPSIARQFAEARPVRDFTGMPSMAFRCRVMAGERWAMLPSAAGFVDPLLSSGFPLTLLGIQRLAALLASGAVPSESALQAYAVETKSDLDSAAAMIGALHRNLGRPGVFQPLSMVYFAAAIFSETARRLGRGFLAPGFLLRGRPGFAAEMATACGLAMASTPDESAIRAAVARALAPVDLAGLGQPGRRNRYPVETADLFASAAKVEATREELQAMLSRCGFMERLRS